MLVIFFKNEIHWNFYIKILIIRVDIFFQIVQFTVKDKVKEYLLLKMKIAIA